MQPKQLKAHQETLERAALGAMLSEPARSAVVGSLTPQDFISEKYGKIFAVLYDHWKHKQNMRLQIPNVVGPLVESGILAMDFPTRYLISLKMDYDSFPRPETLAYEFRECAAYVRKHAELAALASATPADENAIPALETQAADVDAFPETAFWNLSDLDDDESAEELWKGLLAVGAVTLLHSGPKVGKTFTMFGLVSKLLKGEHAEFLGLPTRPGGVIWLTEEARATLKEKRERFKLEAKAPVHFLSRRSPQLAALSLKDALTTACRMGQKRGARLVIIDTLGAWAFLDGEAENNASVVESLFHRIKSAATQHGMAALVLHHSGKRGKTARGSTALEAAADVVMRLSAMDEHPNRRALTIRSRFGEAPSRIEFEYKEGDGFTLNLDTPHDDLLRLIPEQAPGITLNELKDNSKWSIGSIWNALRLLESQERIFKSGTGTRKEPLVYRRKNDFINPPPTGVSTELKEIQVEPQKGDMPSIDNPVISGPKTEAPAVRIRPLITAEFKKQFIDSLGEPPSNNPSA